MPKGGEDEDEDMQEANLIDKSDLEMSEGEGSTTSGSRVVANGWVSIMTEGVPRRRCQRGLCQRAC